MVRIAALSLALAMSGCIPIDWEGDSVDEARVGSGTRALVAEPDLEQGNLPARFEVVPPTVGEPGGDDALALGTPQLVFLNRDGGIFAGDDNGQNDSRGDITSLVPRTGSVTIPAWSQGDEAWEELFACVRRKFARFNVEFADEDPCAGQVDCSIPHLEAVVGGRYTAFEAFGMPESGGGITLFCLL